MAENSTKPQTNDTDTLDMKELYSVLLSLKKGDFSVRMPIDKTGMAGKISDLMNEIIESNNTFENEFKKAVTLVGEKGKIDYRLPSNKAGDRWSAYEELINNLVNDVSLPVKEIVKVIEAVAAGDLTQVVETEIEGKKYSGEFLKTAKTVNSMVKKLQTFSSEITRVLSEVGVMGRFEKKASVRSISGVWKDMINSVNSMAETKSIQTQSVKEIVTAIAQGDLTKKITVDAKGEILDLKNTINTMVDRLNSFASEVTRVALEVGTDGKLGGQAKVEGISGTWKDLTDSVNVMAGNLTDQMRNISEVATAVADGDLSSKITVDVKGEISELKNAINTMVDRLNSFASEVTRVALEVGTEGKLGGQTQVENASGTWKDLTDSVNLMVNNLTDQVRDASRVTTAVAKGDLSQKITVDVKGEMLEWKNIINTMVDQLNSFASEVTRVALEVGTDGKLGGQAEVEGVSGTWKDLTDSVNIMAGNLTDQMRNISEVATAVAKGDLSSKITVDAKGEIFELKNTLNIMVDQLNSFASEVTRVAYEVGTDGKLGGQAQVKGVSGTWKDLTDNVNLMVSNLTDQVRDISKVATAVAKGNLSSKITVDAEGEILELKNTLNIMVDQLNSFASEVTRVAYEVGTEGKLGVQGKVEGVSGTWKDLTDNVNLMASNLTDQVRDISKVATAVAEGDLSSKITVDAKGEIFELKNTLNIMVDQLNSFASEVTRVAYEVGTEGKLGGQGKVEGVSGTWKDLTDNVNLMASNLTYQVRDISKVATAVAKGDLSSKITVDAEGEIFELKNAINIMVDRLNSFASEVTRVAREVGTDGKLGGQAIVKGVSGTWKDLTDNVNLMVGNLTDQVRDASNVTTAVANGDLSQKVTVDVKGEMLEWKNIINTMVDQLNSFSSEVTRVAYEVGTEGKLGVQGEVEGVSGTWKDLTDNVNLMASNLTDQVRDISKVATAVAEGDLSSKITVDAKGEIQELKDAINIMVDRLNSFAFEVTRVAREVGTDGKLGGQAIVEGVSGTWKDLTDNVNLMVSNLTDQVRDASNVTTAVANGDLSQKVTVDVKGEMLEWKNIINTMVDQLNSFASEVTRVAREVGTDGKLGGQGKVEGASGIWKDLTDNVNIMVSNLTDQTRDISKVATAVANGDLSSKITVDARGEIQELKDAINIMVDRLNSFASEVTRVAREVGTDGKLGGQGRVEDVSGIWKDLTDNVNLMVSNLTYQVRDISKVATAVAKGDLSSKITVDARGEIQELKDTINTMVDQLSSFASEVTRVAREVGTEGKLGGQGKVEGVSGIWKDLTDNVNTMALNLTNQVRDIAKVVTAISKGNLQKKMTVEAEGEIAELTETINNMLDTLASFAEQVSSVAHEVGVEGKLGAQANVPGASGIWKSLTDNVNQLAENLTIQVRAINTVATAVATGDLSHSVTVNAVGEVALLKDNVNEMIVNLKETTRKNNEQDWLNTNLAKFSRMLQGQRDMHEVCKMILSELAPVVKSQHGVFYLLETDDEHQALKLYASYGFQERKHIANQFKPGEGLLGQCLIEKQRILLTDVPNDYIRINSALGEATPLNVIVIPILFEGNALAVMELASFTFFSDLYVDFLDQLAESIGIMINTIHVNMRTEELLKQSQSLTEELQQQQEELSQTNEELEEKARLLVDQKAEVEQKNNEVEQSRQILEDKAEQLAITSKYKSEFLANMSHELRTPLNSLLVLAQQLKGNVDKNLTKKQVEYANIICDSGNELLQLINDILDLSKIESGTVTPSYETMSLSEIRENIENSFQYLAEEKGLDFNIEIQKGTPKSINTDQKRIIQVLKNLLSNAFKFTTEGSVSLEIGPAYKGWTFDNESLNNAEQVLAYKIIDTGIGIPLEKQKIIFEAFHQADGSTSRKYGGTGLGLAISRDIAQILGGEITVESAPGQGSEFTLYLPVNSENTIDLKPSKGESPIKIDTIRYRSAKVSSSKIEANDDRNNITASDKILIIIEDDKRFAHILSDMAKLKGFKVIATNRGSNAMELIRKYMPTAILLDLHLPDVDGWTILERVKSDINLRHIPVHIISVEDERLRGLQEGALTYLNKPVSNEDLEVTFENIKDQLHINVQNLLIVSGENKQWEANKVLDGINVNINSANSGKDALAALEKQSVDCIIIDSNLADMSVSQFIGEIQKKTGFSEIPIIVYERDDLEKEEQNKLKELAEKSILKEVKSPERLLDEVTLFLHKVVDNLPDSKREILKKIYQSDDVLQEKNVLIVDDDMRNIFAMTSVLEQHSVNVLSAENGKEAISVIKNNPDIHVILMDIMMPEMDGYETTRAIRKMSKFKSIPIIALTAKAMKGDREKCIEAGASDYITKPVDIDQLLSLLRVWLYK